MINSLGHRINDGLNLLREEKRVAASQLVSTALVQPAIASWQDSPFRPKEGVFAQSTVEKRFAPILQQQLADRITQASNFSLIDVVTAKFGQLERGQHL
jgi:hypothetical protein